VKGNGDFALTAIVFDALNDALNQASLFNRCNQSITER
jgi:hypothetical protein